MFASELSHVLELAGDPAFAVDDEQLIRAWNHPAQKLLGYEASEVLGKSCSPIFRAQSAVGTAICREQCKILDCAFRSEEIPSFEAEVSTRSGRRIWVRTSILVFRDNHTSRHLIAHILHDINWTKEREEILAELGRIARQIALLEEQKDALLPPASPLTEREATVLRLISQGKESGTIARELGVSPGTLRNHVSRINEKLETHNRVEAVFQAKRRHFL